MNAFLVTAGLMMMVPLTCMYCVDSAMEDVKQDQAARAAAEEQRKANLPPSPQVRVALRTRGYPKGSPKALKFEINATSREKQNTFVYVFVQGNHPGVPGFRGNVFPLTGAKHRTASGSLVIPTNTNGYVDGHKVLVNPGTTTVRDLYVPVPGVDRSDQWFSELRLIVYSEHGRLMQDETIPLGRQKKR